MDAQFLISAARLRLMSDRSAGLLAEVGYSMDHVADDSIPTLCTNGRQVKYSPAFVSQLAPVELETALAHEYGHVALLHPVRCPPHYDHETANEAMDYAVNAWLKAAGRTIPETWLYDIKWTGLSWEAIYTLLMREKQQPPEEDQPQPEQQPEPDQSEPDDDETEQDEQEAPQDAPAPADDAEAGDEGEDPAGDDSSPAAGDSDEGEDQPGPGEGEPAPGDPAPSPGKPGDRGGDVEPYPGKDGQPATENELSEAAAELTDRIARIAQACEIAGQGSEGSRRFLDSLTTPRDPDLYEALAQLLERAANDHTYRRLNRRLMHAGIFPGLDGEECPPLVVCVDTSGSITDALLAAFSEKIKRAVADFRPRSVTVIYCDDEINGEPETYTPDDMPDLTPHGGGGTSFKPPFQWVADNMDEPPAALVYLTDLCGDAPDEAPDYPVIWGKTPSTWGATIPVFGQIVPLVL
jgi:predicted metal-dependent peptidase